MNLLFGLTTSSIVGSVVFITLLLLHPIISKIFSKTWHYYSLLIPLIFLLGGTHVAISLTDTILRLTEQNTSFILKSQETPMDMTFEFIRLSIFDNLMLNIPELELDSETGVGLSGYLTIVHRIMAYFERFALLLLAVWAIGATLFIVINTKRYLEYRRLVLHKTISITDIDCKIPIFISMPAHTPMLIGIVKPKIILPNMYFSDEELKMILAHEMVHYNRKDLFIKLLMLIANAIHWFNPAVYALSRHLNMICELSCDEKVVSEMDAQSRKLYGETILHVLQNSAVQKTVVGNVTFATNLCNSKRNFKRRLISMMNAKRMKKPIVALALATGILVIGGGLVISNAVNSVMPVYANEIESIAYAPQTEIQFNDEYSTSHLSPEELQAIWEADDMEVASLLALNYVGGIEPEDFPPFAFWTRTELLAEIGTIVEIEPHHYKMNRDELVVRVNIARLLMRITPDLDESQLDNSGFFEWIRENYTELNVAVYEEMGAPQWFIDRLRAEISEGVN